jgi:hypothetical protein
MHIWLHTSAKSAALTPSAAFSVVAHAVLIGGAVFGTGRASRLVEQAIAERVYFLPPPDRTPSAQPAAERVRYVLAGHGAPRQGEQREKGQPAGAPDQALPDQLDQRGPDDVTQAERPAIDATSDSVYSILTVDQGSVIARFVIDTLGRTDMTTVEILASTHPEFTQAVRDALPAMRYNPGSVGGRLVRQLVEQGFEFHITPPVPGTAADHTRATPPR